MGTARLSASLELDPGHAPADPRSHAGLNGRAREQVSDIQRARMLTAMVEEVSERGAGNVAVAHVVARSGVSRRTFYEIFADREACFLAAFDTAITRVEGEVAPAYEQRGRWRERIRAALVAGLSLLDSEPDLARLVIVEALGAGPKALEHRARAVKALVAVVEEGRAEAGARYESEAPLLTAEGVVGAVLALLHARLSQRSSERLLELANPLMSMIVLPLPRACGGAQGARPTGSEGGGEART
jgi:AcrR family transcriptional regulator